MAELQNSSAEKRRESQSNQKKYSASPYSSTEDIKQAVMISSVKKRFLADRSGTMVQARNDRIDS